MGEACWVSGDSAELTGSMGSEQIRENHSRRLRRMVTDHMDFLWRSIRRLGVAESEVDDAVQQVFLLASRKLAAIEPAKERSFLFGTALRVASEWRRSRRRRPEDAHERVAEGADPGLNPEQMVAQRRARHLLDEVLASMTFDLRVVFVLFELEEMTTLEIAKILEIPSGTVASRLRRARDEFQAGAKRIRLREGTQEALP